MTGSSHNNTDNPPPFLPLEESNNTSHSTNDSQSLMMDESVGDGKRKRKSNNPSKNANQSDKIKKGIGIFMALLVLFLLYDAIVTPPEKRFLKPDASDRFLRWVQHHPLQGIAAFIIVFAVAVVLLLPVGTPLTIGCGFVYKGAYGWKLGVVIATVVSIAGSAAGAVTCFLLGRYLLRDHVKTWIRKYPLFVAIDIGTYGNSDVCVLFATDLT